MMQWIEGNWPTLTLAAAVTVVLIFWLLANRRRTRVRFAEDGEPARRNQALIDAAPVAQASPAAQVESELVRLKGVGPKLVAELAAMGVTRLSTVAAWDDAEIARIDSQLGRFAGRITRDDWVGQARMLEAGDAEAFETRFGKL